MELTLVMPVYNEQEIIATVISSWHMKLENLNINFEIHAYNDGSKDNTLDVLNSLSGKYPRLRVFDK